VLELPTSRAMAATARPSCSISQGTLPWQPIKVKKSAFFPDQSTLLRCHSETGCNIAILKKLDFKRLNRMNFSTLRTIMVTSVQKPLLRQYGKNRHITPNISECHGPILTNFTGLVGVLVRIIIPIFTWQSPKGRCHGNQLNLGDVRRLRQERSLLVALAFDNGLVDREAAFKRLNGNNPVTSCTNLMNFHPIISHFTLLKRTIFAAIRPKFYDDLHSSPWHSETDWKITILISA